jgi:hypothetical protein
VSIGTNTHSSKLCSYPLVIMASIYEIWLQFDMNDAWSIAALQNKHVDGLVFSGKDHLPTLDEEFDRVEMREKFMSTRPKVPKPEARYPSLEIPHPATMKCTTYGID